MLWVELSSYKRKAWELWIFILETLTQVYYSDTYRQYFFINTSFNNLLPPIFKSCFTLSALIFTVITQSHRLLIRYLNHPIELILMERIQSLKEPLIVGIKLNISSVICHLKDSAQPKLKVYFSKDALENINERVILIKQTYLL